VAWVLFGDCVTGRGRLRGFANDAWGTLCGALDGSRLDAVCARLSSSARERIAYAAGDLPGITLEKSDQFFGSVKLRKSAIPGREDKGERNASKTDAKHRDHWSRRHSRPHWERKPVEDIPNA
jgi:hypothetical protein